MSVIGFLGNCNTKMQIFYLRIVYYASKYIFFHDKWVPVTKTWRDLRLRMEGTAPIWSVAANILNKQSRTADKGWSYSLGVGQGVDNFSP